MSWICARLTQEYDRDVFGEMRCGTLRDISGGVRFE